MDVALAETGEGVLLALFGGRVSGQGLQGEAFGELAQFGRVDVELLGQGFFPLQRRHYCQRLRRIETLSLQSLRANPEIRKRFRLMAVPMRNAA